MEYGITTIACLPQRREPSHRSEMCSQFLFGERFQVLERSGQWQRVRNESDGYEGWVDSGGIRLFDGLRQQYYEGLTSHIQSVPFVDMQSVENGYPLRSPAGSVLRYDPDNPLTILCESAYQLQQPCMPMPAYNPETIRELARPFLGVPYLWGGRSMYGCDCSGFVQTMMRMLGIRMRRDANQQVSLGTAVHLIEESRTGDLAFFDDEEGGISHVGMILDPGQIIHASGQVRIDKLDHQGIFNESTKEYTHRLRVIKRILKAIHDDHS